jgi:diaminopimelate epimerase
LIPFAKAHACGNDFLVVERRHVANKNLAELAQHLCSRNTSVGADGVEYFEWTGERSGKILLHNADGSIAEISGNGTRCVAAWMATQKSAKPGDTLTIETDAGSRQCMIIEGNGHRYQIASGMGVPTVARHTVVLSDGTSIEGVVISTGNPHFVIFCKDKDFSVSGRTWQEVGHEICHHPDFPAQTNVEFAHVLSSGEILIRIFERGVGPTTSSGTGTCATATASISFGGCKSPLRVVAPGGAQTIEWSGAGTELRLTGSAELIAQGEAY